MVAAPPPPQDKIVLYESNCKIGLRQTLVCGRNYTHTGATALTKELPADFTQILMLLRTKILIFNDGIYKQSKRMAWIC
jgi:hypothetical protein